MNMDKRDSSRVIFKTKAIINYNDNSIDAEIENISTKGMYVNTKTVVNPGEIVGVTICLSGSSTDLTVRVNGTISRVGDNGFAIVFKEIELDSYIHLKNIVSYSIGSYVEE